jgi:hypothetical protein
MSSFQRNVLLYSTSLSAGVIVFHCLLYSLKQAYTQQALGNNFSRCLIRSMRNAVATNTRYSCHKHASHYSFLLYTQCISFGAYFLNNRTRAIYRPTNKLSTINQHPFTHGVSFVYLLQFKSYNLSCKVSFLHTSWLADINREFS